MLDSFVLLAYASLAAWKTFLQWLLACLNFALDSKVWFCWYKRKKWFLWPMAATQAAKNYEEEWGLTLIFTMRDIYINSNLKSLMKFNSSSKVSEFKDIFPWNISHMIKKAIPLTMTIVIKYAVKRGIPFGRKSMDTKTTKWTKRHCRTNISIRRKEEIQKNRTVRVRVSDLSWKVNHLSHLR